MMSAPHTAVSDDNVVVVSTEAPKSVAWHDHHGMELTHVREFEPSEPTDSDDDRGMRRDRQSPSVGCCVIQ